LFYEFTKVPIPRGGVRARARFVGIPTNQGWAQGSFVDAEAEVKAERSRHRRGKAAMSLTEVRQGRRRGRELEAEARPSQLKKLPRCRLEPRQMPRGLHPCY